MTLEACTALLAPLALAVGAEMDQPTFKAYYRALKDIPEALVAHACDTAAKAPKVPYEPLMPPAPRLRAYAEQARRQLLEAHPYVGCIECAEAIGWRPRLDQPRAVERCPCHARHQQTLAALGVGHEALSLPAAPPADWTQAGEVR